MGTSKAGTVTVASADHYRIRLQPIGQQSEFAVYGAGITLIIVGMALMVPFSVNLRPSSSMWTTIKPQAPGIDDLEEIQNFERNKWRLNLLKVGACLFAAGIVLTMFAPPE